MLTVKICLGLLLLNAPGFGSLIRGQQQQKQLQYFLEQVGLQRKVYSPLNSRNGQLAITNLDDFRDVFRDFRKLQLQQFKLNEKAILKLNRQRGKLQRKIGKSEKFPCTLNDTRSVVVPTSVHRLRPGDIDIIGALGDSLTAGTAILSESVLQETAEFRGITFIGGGLKDWRTYLTLPNILKVFNPQLYGYAVDNALGCERDARFNVAEFNALTQDMPFQAHVLVRRLQTDPKVDMSNHWKLISLLIGGNDICTEMCSYDRRQDFLADYRENLYKTIEILKIHIPRLIVNILAVANIQDNFLPIRNSPFLCYAAHHVGCSCIVSKKWSSSDQKKNSQTVKRVQQIGHEVANLPEFQTDTFAVIYQPFPTNLTLLKEKTNEINLSYFAADCFHFSQLGHAAAANMLWNNMLQPEGRKERGIRDPFLKFICPTKERPYIATLQNSAE